MPYRLLLSLQLASLALLTTVSAHAASPQIVLEQSRASKEAFIEGFRRTGKMERDRLDATEAMLRKTIDDSESAEVAPELLFELGSVTRLAFRFTNAVPILEKAAAAAAAAGRPDLAFDAWMDVARSHFLGTQDHGAAAAAFEKAVLVAGDAPADRQRFRIASYRTGLLSARNELCRRRRSCDYVPLFDDCRRAVDASMREYMAAAQIARAVGWAALAEEAEDSTHDLGLRRDIIDNWENMEKKVRERPELFAPRAATDVLVSSRFGEPSALVGNEDLQKALAAVAQQQDAYGLTRRDARSLFLAGLAMDVSGDHERASQLYLAAVRGLEEERGSLFDPRRRGTVIENRAEFYSKAALRLLDLGRPEPAFEILERMRARGLAELTTFGERDDIGSAELSFLSELLLLEAKASRSERALRDRAVQAGVLDPNDPSLDELLRLERDRSALLRGHSGMAKKLAGSAPWSPVSLAELQARAAVAATTARRSASTLLAGSSRPPTSRELPDPR